MRQQLLHRLAEESRFNVKASLSELKVGKGNIYCELSYGSLCVGISRKQTPNMILSECQYTSMSVLTGVNKSLVRERGR